ncbi:hypothetical protein HA402_013690 [Bradysia odoriphaga]|nr:hypothetical protein HA402_013690 [Bradysia odoriphaga]
MAEISTPNEMVPVRAPVTNITDLCTQCLLTVFSHLDVVDLANLVEANIARKLGKRNWKRLHYQQSIVTAFKIKVRMNVWKTSVRADARYAPKDIKMLRNFGREIEALFVHCRVNYYKYNGTGFDERQNRRYERALEDAIVDNCSKTLTEIRFDSCNKDTMKELDRPFKNVESVQFDNCHLGSALGQLKKWFPKMTELYFTNTYVFDAKCIHQHFPHLESLTVMNPTQGGTEKGKMIFSNSNLEAFAQLNPKLETLNIGHDDVDEPNGDGSNAIIVDWNLMTSISKNFRLKELKLNLERFRFEHSWQSTVALDSMITLDIECFNGHYLDTIQITSAQLNELKLKIDLLGDNTQIDYEAIATFVIRVTPKQLRIISEWKTFAMENDQIVKMIQLLPQLAELSVKCEWDNSIPDAVMNLLVNGIRGAMQKFVGTFCFDGDEKGNPSSVYLQMRQVFREKIIRNHLVAKGWSYEFDYIDDEDCKRICGESISQKNCTWCLEPDFGDKPRCFQPDLSNSDSCPEEYMYSPDNEQTIIVAKQSTNDTSGFSVPQIYPQRINLRLGPNEAIRLNVRFTQNDTLLLVLSGLSITRHAFNMVIRSKLPHSDGLRAGDVLNFNAEVIVTECPPDPKDWFQTFQIYPVGINESLTVDLEMRCSCPL